NKNQKVILLGVLDKNECDRLIETTAPEDYQKQIKKLQKASQDVDGQAVKSVEIQLDSIPPGFNMKFSGLKKSVVHFHEKEKKLVAFQPLATKELKGLLVAAGDPQFRDSIHNLYVNSTQHRVSLWWLCWRFLLATLG